MQFDGVKTNFLDWLLGPTNLGLVKVCAFQNLSIRVRKA